MKRRSKFKTGCVLASGSVVFGSGGNCLPDDFWITQWDNTLTAAVETLVSVTVVTAIEDSFGTEDEAE